MVSLDMCFEAIEAVLRKLDLFIYLFMYIFTFFLFFLLVQFLLVTLQHFMLCRAEVIGRSGYIITVIVGMVNGRKCR